MQRYFTTQEELRRQELANDIFNAVLIGLLVLLIVGAIVTILLVKRRRRRRFEIAAEQECLMCGSHDLVSKGADEYYRCNKCGYDTDLTDRAEARPYVEQLAGIKFAREGLQVASSRLRDPAPDVGDHMEGHAGRGAIFDSAAADAELAFGRLLKLRAAMPEIWGESPTPVEQATRTLLTEEGVAMMVLRIRSGNEHIPMIGILDRWVAHLSRLEGQLKERIRTFLPEGAA